MQQKKSAGFIFLFVLASMLTNSLIFAVALYGLMSTDTDLPPLPWYAYIAAVILFFVAEKGFDRMLHADRTLRTVHRAFSVGTAVFVFPLQLIIIFPWWLIHGGFLLWTIVLGYRRESVRRQFFFTMKYEKKNFLRMLLLLVLIPEVLSFIFSFFKDDEKIPV